MHTTRAVTIASQKGGEVKMDVMPEKPTARMRRALEYYALDVSPKDPAKIHHPANQGWGSKTIDHLLDAGLIKCGANGWHVLTDLGRAALSQMQQSTPLYSRRLP